MCNIEIVKVTKEQSKDVAKLIEKLLIELGPSAEEDIKSTALHDITKDLLTTSKIWAFLAKKNNINIGLITLHECAAIYAGGVFGEISELMFKQSLDH